MLRRLGRIGITAMLGASLASVVAPPAQATSTAEICVEIGDGCVHRTTVDDETSVTLQGVVPRDRHLAAKWIVSRAQVLMHVAGSDTGFAVIADLRTLGRTTRWRYTTDPLAGPAVYVFRIETRDGITDRAVVEVDAAA